MGRNKRLFKSLRNNRVVAIPTKKEKRVATDEYGNTIHDKNGQAVVEDVQMYHIIKMK